MKYSQRKKFTGFTLIEMLIVIAVIGIIALIVAPHLKNVTTGASSKQIYDFASSAVNNWRLVNMKCGTSNDTSASLVVSSPSTTNSLALIINGSAYLNTTYQACWDEAAIQSLHTKASGNPTDGFRVAGAPVTWSGGGGSSAIGVIFSGLTVETILPLYKQYSSASGAHSAATLPTTADTTDPMIRFTAPSGGVSNLTILFQ